MTDKTKEIPAEELKRIKAEADFVFPDGSPHFNLMNHGYVHGAKAEYLRAHSSQAADQSALVQKLKEYIDFLGKEVSDNAVFMHLHNCSTPQATVDRGIQLRKEIADLEQSTPIVEPAVETEKKFTEDNMYAAWVEGAATERDDKPASHLFPYPNLFTKWLNKRYSSPPSVQQEAAKGSNIDLELQWIDAEDMLPHDQNEEYHLRWMREGEWVRLTAFYDGDAKQFYIVRENCAMEYLSVTEFKQLQWLYEPKNGQQEATPDQPSNEDDTKTGAALEKVLNAQHLETPPEQPEREKIYNTNEEFEDLCKKLHDAQGRLFDTEKLLSAERAEKKVLQAKVRDLQEWHDSHI